MPSNYQPRQADCRRAAALVVHYGRQDVAGANAIIGEVNADPDPGAATARLLFGVLEMYAAAVPMLHTPRGLTLLSAVAVDLATGEDDQ